MSYQFGTNWSQFSHVVGNVVGPLIGYEVLTAFFLEATFLGVLLFGFDRVPPWLYVLSGAIVALGTAFSAFWILSANSWMQTPAGFEMKNGIAFPTDWLAAIFNPSFPYRFAHMVNAAYLTTGFVVLAVGARYLLAGRHIEVSRTMLRMAIGLVVDPGAAAAHHRRPARPQHARAPADQGGGDGGALGQQRGRRAVRDIRLAQREDREQRLFDLDPARRLAAAHPHAGTASSPGSRACRRRTGRRWRSYSSPSASWSGSACS